MGNYRLASNRGFSLIEVLLALAILATSMAILMTSVSHSGQQSVYSAQLTQASLLARGKMVDLEYMIMEEGFSDADRTYSGSFSDEGFPQMRWEARVEPVEIPPDAEERFMGQINEQLFGGMESDGGALGGNPAFSSMLPQLLAQMPDFVNRIGERVRRVILVVYFDFMGREQPLELTHYVVDEMEGEFEMFGEGDDFDALDEQIEGMEGMEGIEGMEDLGGGQGGGGRR